METGTCNYGKKCKFAHGINELNSKTVPNKGFKTKCYFIFFQLK